MLVGLTDRSSHTTFLSERGRHEVRHCSVQRAGAEPVRHVALATRIWQSNMRLRIHRPCTGRIFLKNRKSDECSIGKKANAPKTLSIDGSRSFQTALSNKRKYPTREFTAFATSVREYVRVVGRDPLIQREIASAINGLVDFLKVERRRVPDAVIHEASRLESPLFSGHDPHFGATSGRVCSPGGCTSGEFSSLINLETSA
jgi:hypothetical protein